MGQEIENKHGSFKLERSAEKTNFVCDKCLEPKTARVSVEWVGLSKELKTICNGCYAYFRS